jgi:phage-related baseplate assembly protein
VQKNAVEDIALVKMAIKKLVNISVTINILPGFDSAIVISNCQDNINNFVADLGLGDNLAQSDIVGILENTEGVDNVNLPLNLFNFSGEISAEVDDLTVEKNEYIRLETGSPQIIV